jgi:hypothetical protein
MMSLVALAYKGLWRIEHAFRELKSGLEIRPVFLRAGVKLKSVTGHLKPATWGRVKIRHW